MTDMTSFETLHPRDSRSKQFVEKANSQPDTSLPTPVPRVAPLTQTVAITVDEFTKFGPLPELPDGLAEPQVAYGTNDSDGSVYVSFTTPDGELDVIAVYDNYDERWGFPGGVTDEDAIEPYVEWATGVCDRIYENDAKLVAAARSTVGMEDKIVAAALNREAPLPETDPAPAPQRAVNRANRLVPAWFGVGHVPDGEHQTTVSDILSDLRHYASANDLDFDEALSSSSFIYQDEVDDPS